MDTAQEILNKYYKGEISISGCWRQLAGLRPGKKSTIVLTAPPSKIYEPLNENELEAIRCLQGASFGMARGASRFVHQIKDAKQLTARQREYLRGLVYRYRRQLWTTNHDGYAREFCAKMMKDIPLCSECHTELHLNKQDKYLCLNEICKQYRQEVITNV